MDAVEQFFSSLGWGLVFLGFISCVLPKCFKRGVIIMLAGDFFLMLAILFPRMFMNLGIFKMDLSYRAIAYVLAVVLWGLFVVPSFLKWLRLRKDPQAANSKDEDKGGDKASNNNSTKLAPSSIFKAVKDNKPQRDSASSLFSGVNKEDR